MRIQDLRPLWRSASLIAILTILLCVWLIIKPGSLQFYVGVETSAIAFCPLLMLPFCFRGIKYLFRRAPVHPGAAAPTQLQWVPILLGLAIISQSVGESFFIYYYQITHQTPFPSLEDAAYLSAYPFLFLAVLLLTRRRLPTSTRIRIFLDGLMIMIGATTFSWYFILGPTILQGGNSLFSQIVAAAYPCGDLVLIFCLVLLSTSYGETILQPVVFILSLALAANVLADSTYSYRLLIGNSYPLGSITDTGWLLGYMLYGLGAQAVYLVIKRQPSINTEPAPTRYGYSFFPYLFIPAVGALFVYALHSEKNAVLNEGVFLGGFVLISLLVVRQFFAIRETISYNKRLQAVQQELHVKNSDLSSANMQLEEQKTQVATAYEQQIHLNELKDQFLLNVNHELRTPLAAVQGYLELLQLYQDKVDRKERETFLNHALQGCEELQILIGNVMDAIRTGFNVKRPPGETVVLAKVVRDVLDNVDPGKQENRCIRIDIAETVTVWADQPYLRQILRNLFSNAFKYTPPDTAVVVSTMSTPEIAQDVDASSMICIYVQDTGPGIPSDELPLLFGKFVRLKRDITGTIRGTGLGLYICKQLVEAMGGSIWVESQGIPGQGSRFCFTLPQTAPTSSSKPTPALFP